MNCVFNPTNPRLKITFIFLSFFFLAHFTYAATPTVMLWPDIKIKGAPDFDSVGLSFVPTLNSKREIETFTFIFIKEVLRTDPHHNGSNTSQTVIENFKDEKGESLIVDFGAPRMLDHVKVWSFAFNLGAASDQLEIQTQLWNENNMTKFSIGFLAIARGLQIDSSAILKKKIEMTLRWQDNQWRPFYRTQKGHECVVKSVNPYLTARLIKDENKQRSLQELALKSAVVKCENGKKETVLF
jgi:hypothetical protein